MTYLAFLFSWSTFQNRVLPTIFSSTKVTKGMTKLL